MRHGVTGTKYNAGWAHATAESVASSAASFVVGGACRDINVLLFSGLKTAPIVDRRARNPPFFLFFCR